MQQGESLIEHGPRLVIITITAVFCALLEIIDTTIVNVALNNMRGSLGATLNEISWVITAYSLANVIVIPLTSWLSQQFGRRNYFAASIILFTVCSFLCGNAHSIGELVIFRVFAGNGRRGIAGYITNHYYRKLAARKTGYGPRLFMCLALL